MNLLENLLTFIKVWSGIGTTTPAQKLAFCRSRGKHKMKLLDDTRSDGTRDWECKYCDARSSAAEGFGPNEDCR